METYVQTPCVVLEDRREFAEGIIERMGFQV